MKKAFIQGLITVVLFFSTWFVLTQVDWMSVLKVNKATDKTEEKLGELFYDIFKKSEKENMNPLVASSIDSIVYKICLENGIDKQLIKVHIFGNDEINAFTLPDGHLLIYSGLILASDNQEELIGVICHEIAHMQLNHVMKKLVKEVGLSVILSMTTGNSGSEILNETARLLSSSAFDRKLEKEADIKAVEYLITAKINPEPFANFLYKQSNNDKALKYLTWVSTHPDSKERAKYIMEIIRYESINYESILSTETWEELKKKLKE
jgi:beta-barrel assembly-enhancing protease